VASGKRIVNISFSTERRKSRSVVEPIREYGFSWGGTKMKLPMGTDHPQLMTKSREFLTEVRMQSV
jgi:hypothetical protein